VESQTPRQIAYELQYKNFDPFTVKITLPTVECSQCKRVCGIDPNGSMNNHLGEAMVNAFRSQNIKP
jgi:hypothetical protein